MKCLNQNCSWEGHPVMEMQLSGRVTPTCPDCCVCLEVAEPVASPATVASGSPSPQPQRALALPPLDATAADFVDQAKLQLAAMDAELAAFARIQKQRDRLARMIAFAEAEAEAAADGDEATPN